VLEEGEEEPNYNLKEIIIWDIQEEQEKNMIHHLIHGTLTGLKKKTSLHKNTAKKTKRKFGKLKLWLKGTGEMQGTS